MLETVPQRVNVVEASPTPESNFGRWMALAAALLGWMFDGFEMGLFPLIGGPALADLLGPASAAQATQWFGAIIAVFLVGAATGGVFFGWLGDRIGRVRAMSLSIFTYAVFTGLCGFATEAWHIAALRFVASLGMGGEWSLGVALVNEIWPNKSRALIAGLIGAAANLGFLMVGVLSIGLHRFIGAVEGLLLGIGMPEPVVEPAAGEFRMALPDDQRSAAGASRVFHPAVRARIEEVGARAGPRRDISLVERRSRRRRPSAASRRSSSSGAGRRPASGPRLRRSSRSSESRRRCGDFSSPCAVIWRAPSLPDRSRPIRSASSSVTCFWEQALAGVALLGTWGSIQWAPRWAFQLEPDPRRFSREYTQISSALGAIVFPILAGVVAGRFGRRITYAGLCVGSILVVPASSTRRTIEFDGFFLVSIFLAGGITAAFYGFFPLYLPELFPTVVRATGQGFSYNFGRILAAVGGLQTATLMGMFGGSFRDGGIGAHRVLSRGSRDHLAGT